MTEGFEELQRPTRPEQQATLFEVEPDWRDEWWGMPEFTHDTISPQSSIKVNFLTVEDRADFAKLLGVTVTAQTDSIWHPEQKRLRAGAFAYDGPPTDSRYPICIPSKGRADCQKTGKILDRMGVSYMFFVEETEGDVYRVELGEDHVVVMPFHDLGQGSIPARNFIWEWCRERGYQRHWTVDDNILNFVRLNNNRKLPVRGGGFFRAMEDFVDRYENIAMAGPHNRCFGGAWFDERTSPLILNSRVYSCILLDTTIPDRWRGRYNEDTDLSLRLLKQGYCTMLFTALRMDKDATVGAKNSKPLPGGNTDNVYNTGDHRRAFAESLREQHPDVVDVVYKFGRWHHQVDYSPFKRNKLRLKPGVVPTVGPDNYGMELRRVGEGRG